MKLLVIGNKERFEKYCPDLPIVNRVECFVADRSLPEERIVDTCPDADFILADAISPVTAAMMERMPQLKLVHSEGVAYNAIDTAYARSRDIFVCNNQGCNAIAVAEQTILLMLGLLKNAPAADAAVRAGKQIDMKERMMVDGIGELGDCTVGLVGFGSIAREVALRVRAFGANVLYHKRSRLDAQAEEQLGATYCPLDEMLAQSDFVSLHVPVTDQTRGMANAEFFAQMKPGAFLINTARGEIVDNAACLDALSSGRLAGAGFDTIAPEPVSADNPLVALPPELKERVMYSPHVGGVTTSTFRRVHRHVWDNIERIASGQRPDDIVNGL